MSDLPTYYLVAFRTHGSVTILRRRHDPDYGGRVDEFYRGRDDEWLASRMLRHYESGRDDGDIEFMPAHPDEASVDTALDRFGMTRLASLDAWPGMDIGLRVPRADSGCRWSLELSHASTRWFVQLRHAGSSPATTCSVSCARRCTHSCPSWV